MSVAKNCLIASLLLALAWPWSVDAQTCPQPTSIACDQSLTGSTSASGLNRITMYPCWEYSFEGPEAVYLLEIAHPAQVEIVLYPNWPFDAGLMVIPELDGDCYPSTIRGCTDSGGRGEGEGLEGVLAAGSYFIVVDGYQGSYGNFQLNLSCESCQNCVDADGDGYYAYHPADCICGDDCLDSDAGVHPSVPEICEDGLDQNCDGYDDACPACGAHYVANCGDQGRWSTADGSQSLDRYCTYNDSYWPDREIVAAITPTAEGVVDVQIDNMDFDYTYPSQVLDAFAFTDYGQAGVCDKNQCLDASVRNDGSQRLAFYAQAGETYYVAVDGRGDSRGSFDASFQCRSESCPAAMPVACTDDLTDDTTGENNSISAYQHLSSRQLGPDKAYLLSSEHDAEVTVTLHIDDGPDGPPDLALVVLAEAADGSCQPSTLIAASDLLQNSNGNPPELLQFFAAAGSVHTLLVDGGEEQDAGSYTLRIDCAITCPAGLSACGGQCVDLTNDLNHCGQCDNACDFAHGAGILCVAGSCEMSGCQDGYGDCNADLADGCETPLGTTENCAACDDLCSFAQAQAACAEASCVLASCQTGFGNCDADDGNGCETELNSAEHCGACQAACVDPMFCLQGSCLSECPDGLTWCQDSCMDTSADLNNCGACGVVCAFAHAAATCVEASCQIGACDAGWADCELAVADGCETALGTDNHCAACNDACLFAQAQGSCTDGSCVMGACATGWADCVGGDSDGCESDLSLPAHCGSCANTCTGQESCIAGECSQSCADADSDGHEAPPCGSDCNDQNASIFPGATEICGDGVDQNCDGQDDACTCSDGDGDGYPAADCGGSDCDDRNGFIHPGQSEICGDDIDQDCDGQDLACPCPDADSDGYGALPCGNDCNDNNPNIHPGAAENCGDGIDQNCDGMDRPCPATSSGCSCETGAGDLNGWLGWLLLGMFALWRRLV